MNLYKLALSKLSYLSLCGLLAFGSAVQADQAGAGRDGRFGSPASVQIREISDFRYGGVPAAWAELVGKLGYKSVYAAGYAAGYRGGPLALWGEEQSGSIVPIEVLTGQYLYSYAEAGGRAALLTELASNPNQMQLNIFNPSTSMSATLPVNERLEPIGHNSERILYLGTMSGSALSLDPVANELAHLPIPGVGAYSRSSSDGGIYIAGRRTDGAFPIYTTDGTTTGTEMIGSIPSPHFYEISLLGAINGQLISILKDRNLPGQPHDFKQVFSLPSSGGNATQLFECSIRCSIYKFGETSNKMIVAVQDRADESQQLFTTDGNTFLPLTSSGYEILVPLEKVGPDFMFLTYSRPGNINLMATDGSAQSTRVISNLFTGTLPEHFYRSGDYHTVINGRLFFSHCLPEDSSSSPYNCEILSATANSTNVTQLSRFESQYGPVRIRSAGRVQGRSPFGLSALGGKLFELKLTSSTSSGLTQ